MNNETINSADPDYKKIEMSLRALGLIQSPDPVIVALTGGVSSLIVRIDEGDRSFCAKSALNQLKVEADWLVPVHRNQSEVAWMRIAEGLVPGAVPNILGDDPKQNVFAMQWLDPDQYPVWKQQLMDGLLSVSFACDVGRVLGKIHSGTARDSAMAVQFSNDSDFDALRLDPYLRATAAVHPGSAERLVSLCDVIQQNRRVLIHGDVSPKNILQGPEGPVFLDAECATYGDPAFDLAFCLNHLILKAVHLPEFVDALSDCFYALVDSYLAHVHWETVADVEARTSALLPALALARVDGKSPVEYLRDDEKAWIRKKAIELVNNPVSQLDAFLKIWKENLN
ncbi:MAG: phosphotransferase family protein [Granulosicoccus sp.]